MNGRVRRQELKMGSPLAFLIDFLDPADPERIAFRVYYQDAASRPPLGYSALADINEHDVDLAAVTVPGREGYRESVDKYPAGLLRHTRAHHALLVHYEDFFRPVRNKNGGTNGVRLASVRN